MKFGMIVTWPGIINVARYIRNIASRPGKRNRANAYAASDDVSTSPAVTQTAMKRLLNRYRPKGTTVQTTRKLSKVIGSGIHVGGYEKCEPPLNAVESIHRNGTTMMIAPTETTTYASTRFSRLRT